MLAALLTLVLPTTGARAAPEKLSISVAVGNAIYWDVYAAVERGFFKEEGFAPEYVSMQSSTNSTQNLIAGAVDLQGGSPEPVVDAVERGAEIGILAAASRRSSGILNVRPDIRTVADLKGKTIGVSALRGGELWELRKLLAANGLGPKDYEVIQIGVSPAKYAALQRGSISAAILLQPSALLAESNGLPGLLSFWSIESYAYPVYAVGRAWAHADNHGARAARAIVKGQQWLNDPANRAAAVAILQKTTKRDQAIADATYQQMIAADHFFVSDGKVELAGIGRLLAAMKEDGDVKGSPDPRKFMIAPEDGGLSN
jgi:NitT/TauT family transport system substrate-binding protein